MSEAWDLMQQAERLRKRWHAAEEEYEDARAEGKPAAELDSLRQKSERLKAEYFEKAKAAVASANRE
jgi:ElaB/YqjD/DUF883 family membrane-anchored ribosome-binding protein